MTLSLIIRLLVVVSLAAGSALELASPGGCACCARSETVAAAPEDCCRVEAVRPHSPAVLARVVPVAAVAEVPFDAARRLVPPAHPVRLPGEPPGRAGRDTCLRHALLRI